MRKNIDASTEQCRSAVSDQKGGRTFLLPTIERRFKLFQKSDLSSVNDANCQGSGLWKEVRFPSTGPDDVDRAWPVHGISLGGTIISREWHMSPASINWQGPVR